MAESGKNPMELARPLVDARRMKRWLVVFCLFAVPAVKASPAGPAFAAFGAIASQPYGSQARVVEIHGERGEPQPAEWVVTLHDPTARGGVREITVDQGKITSERTPLRGLSDVSAMIPLDPAKLGVDADGIFRIAQREAVKNQAGFHWIDYRLKVDPESLAPVWDVKLFDSMGAAVGTLRISAQGGTLVRGFTPDPDGRARAEATPKSSRVGGVVGEVADTAESVATKTKNSTLRFLGTVQEVLVGERTIGPKEDE